MAWVIQVDLVEAPVALAVTVVDAVVERHAVHSEACYEVVGSRISLMVVNALEPKNSVAGLEEPNSPGQQLLLMLALVIPLSCTCRTCLHKRW